MKNLRKQKRGFTLLEILLVVGIISLLAGIVIIAINPGKQLAQVRNTERRSDIKQIKSAVEQYYISVGRYPISLTGISSLTEVCDTGSLSTTTDSEIDCTGLVDLTALVPTYITAIPVDPQASTTDGAGYKVMIDPTNKIITTAPEAELSAFIAIGTTTPAEEEEGSTLGDGLVVHYLMNDNLATTNVLDNLSNYNGTAVRNTSLLTVAGEINTALAFNGSSDWVDIPGSTAVNMTTAVSMSAWVKTTSTTGMHAIVGKLYDWFDNRFFGGANFGLWYVSDQLYVLYNGGAYYTVAAGLISDNNWHHIIGTLDVASNTATIYVDGNNQTIALTGVQDPVISLGVSTQNITIGKNNKAGYPYYFAGSIDDVRIYNRVLTEDEIIELAAGTEEE